MTVGCKVVPDAKTRIADVARMKGETPGAWIRGVVMAALGEGSPEKRSAFAALEEWGTVRSWEGIEASIRSAIAKSRKEGS